jgi:hypothetical protein
MPKPTTKSELMLDIRKEWDTLEQFYASLSPEQMSQAGAIGEWSPKDVLAHLAEWQQLCLDWYNAGLHGDLPHLPAEGYKWSQMSALNRRIFEKYRDWSLASVSEFFQSTYQQILNLVEATPEEKLFNSGCYSWTGNDSLSAYIIPCTSHHYRWARTEMRKGLRKAGSA